MPWSALPAPLSVAIGDDASGTAIAVDGAAGGTTSFLVIDDETGVAGEHPASALAFDLGAGDEDAGDEPDDPGTGTDEPEPAAKKGK